ncbi:Hint domain-containing protein [uncultured Roseobacter sp.]|uniref:Hint domain-containing protein n=1 Tax=uncultured Roseobacter sp. TaxID=114847 RepID=UPI002607B33E|nr:Hint domain-containing protein [uncultured Roseobacter sp.]
MTWLALADQKERRFSLRGIGADNADRRLYPDDPDFLMTRGSLLFETRLSPDGAPQVLLSFNRSWPEQRSLSFQAVPGGGVVLVQVHGGDIAHAALTHSVPARTDVLRVTFAWDTLRGVARLTVERPEEDQITTVDVPGVRPFLLQDLRDMLMGRGDCVFAGDMVFAALSDRLEEVGPVPGLDADAMVATPDGYRPVATLRRGVTVISRDGDVIPVLQTVSRQMPARGSFAPVRLRAPYFGLRDDVVTTPDQRLVIDGPEVEYLFGEEAVLVPARHLLNGFAARAQVTGPTRTYCQLILPGHEALMVAGTAMESLCIGRIRRYPERLRHTLLSGFERNMLPEHGRPSYRVLRWFEAIHLARQRAA